RDEGSARVGRPARHQPRTALPTELLSGRFLAPAGGTDRHEARPALAAKLLPGRILGSAVRTDRHALSVLGDGPRASRRTSSANFVSGRACGAVRSVEGPRGEKHPTSRSPSLRWGYPCLPVQAEGEKSACECQCLHRG